MARVTLASQAIIIAQLTADLNDSRTQVGVLMNSLEASNQVRADLQDERDVLILENEQLITILSSQAQVTATVAKSALRMTVLAAVVESAPVIQITDADKAVYRKFMALKVSDRKQWDDIIKFARPQFGNVGVDNIQAVRAAWHEYQASVDDAIDEQYQAVQDVADLQAS